MPEPPRQNDPPPPNPAFPEQNADGVDLALMHENLKLTPRVRKAERLRQHVLRIHKLAGITRDLGAA